MTGAAPPGRVAEVLASVVSAGDRFTWAAALVEHCALDLDAVGVGLAVAGPTGLVGVAAATAGAGRAGEDLQFELGEGPCRVASETCRVVEAPWLGGDGRWLQFGPEAVRVGIQAAWSAPLQAGALLIGVLDVYRGTPGPMSVEDAVTSAAYAQAATAVLLLLTGPEVAGSVDDVEVMELADIRPVVHQASGMVSLQLDVDLATALVRLRAYAFSSGRALRDVAADVVDRRLALDDNAAGGHTLSGSGSAPEPRPDIDAVPDPTAGTSGHPDRSPPNRGTSDELS